MALRGDLIKETCRLIREARKRWDAHENESCRRLRARAMAAYEELSKAERDEVPETLRVWLRFRSEKYFGKGRAGGGNGMSSRPQKKTKKKKAVVPDHTVAARKVSSPVGPIFLLSSRKGLCGVHFGHRLEVSQLPDDQKRDRVLNQAEKELDDYFAKKRELFNVPLDVRGSAFQRAVWRQLSEIPFGETRSYGELADRMDNPKAVRAVGAANGQNPVSIIVPCHRVIGKGGSMVGFGGGVEIKQQLLRLEGLIFDF